PSICPRSNSRASWRASGASRTGGNGYGPTRRRRVRGGSDVAVALIPRNTAFGWRCAAVLLDTAAMSLLGEPALLRTTRWFRGTAFRRRWGGCVPQPGGHPLTSGSPVGVLRAVIACSDGEDTIGQFVCQPCQHPLPDVLRNDTRVGDVEGQFHPRVGAVDPLAAGSRRA